MLYGLACALNDHHQLPSICPKLEKYVVINVSSEVLAEVTVSYLGLQKEA